MVHYQKNCMAEKKKKKKKKKDKVYYNKFSVYLFKYRVRSEKRSKSWEKKGRQESINYQM